MARLTSSDSRNSAKLLVACAGAGGATTTGAGGARTCGGRLSSTVLLDSTDLALGDLVRVESEVRDDERGRVIRAAGLSLVVTRFLSSLGRNKHVRVQNFAHTEMVRLVIPATEPIQYTMVCYRGNPNDRHTAHTTHPRTATPHL